MDIIKTYLDNMFASLPKSKEVIKMKQDLLLNMEEKYRELKDSGKTENEAIGIVISEFGNIQELAEELGVDLNSTEESENIVTLETAKDYIHSSKKYGFIIAIGVFLCILAPAFLIFLLPAEDLTITDSSRTILGFVALFLLIAIAVGLFIYAGINLNKFSYLKKDVLVPNNVKEYVKDQKKKFDPKFVLGLIISVIMFILSPVLLIVFSVINDSLGYDKYSYNLAAGLLLVIIAIGCLIIISLGLIKDSHNVLLQIGEYTKKQKKAEKVISAIAGIYWPIIIVVYLIWSFIGGAWAISWIVWPIAGIIFGGISGIVNASVKDE